MRGLFVTGTDTGVGKTVLSAALVMRSGYRYWKPIQTGPDDDTAEVRRLCPEAGILDQGVRFPDPVSPHLAAHRAGTCIDLNALLPSRDREGAEYIPPSRDREGAVIVEGAGGVLAPVNDSQTMADLMVLLDLPVVVAARSTLGTINHTLLTLEALRARALTVRGVVMIGDPNPDSRIAIERHGNARVLGEMPWFHPLTSERLRQWADGELDPGILA